MFRRLFGVIGLVILLAMVACSNQPSTGVTTTTGQVAAAELKRPPFQHTATKGTAVRASQAVIIAVDRVDRDVTTGQTKMVFKLFAGAGKEVLQKRNEYRFTNWYQSPRRELMSDTGYIVDTSGLGFVPTSGGTHQGEALVLGGSQSDAAKKESRKGYALEQIHGLLLDVGVVYPTTGNRPDLEMGDAVVGDNLYLFPIAIVKEGERHPGFPLGTRIEILSSETRKREGFNVDPHTVGIAVYPPNGAPYQTTIYEGSWFGQQSPEQVLLPLIIPVEVQEQLLNLQPGNLIYVFVDQ